MLSGIATLAGHVLQRLALARGALFARRCVVIRFRDVPGQPWAWDISAHRAGTRHVHLELASRYLKDMLDRERELERVKDEIDHLVEECERPGRAQ